MSAVQLFVTAVAIEFPGHAVLFPEDVTLNDASHNIWFMNELELLPPHLAEQSLTPHEIVLPYDAALQAIELLTAQGYFIVAWEGWVKVADGRHGHSGRHQGTVEFRGTEGHSLEDRLQEAALFARQTIEQSQQEWNAAPEVAGGTLYFCLYIEASE